MVCFTLVALGITSCQKHLSAEESGEVGTYQLVSRQDGGTSIKMFKINTMNGDTWILRAREEWHPLPHASMPE